MYAIIDKEADPVAYYARNNNLPVCLVQAIINNTSKFNAHLLRLGNGENELEIKLNSFYGLMYIQGKKALEHGLKGELETLFDPKVNLEIGCKIVRALKDKIRPIFFVYDFIEEIYPEQVGSILEQYYNEMNKQLDWNINARRER